MGLQPTGLLIVLPTVIHDGCCCSLYLASSQPVAPHLKLQFRRAHQRRPLHPPSPSSPRQSIQTRWRLPKPPPPSHNRRRRNQHPHRQVANRKWQPTPQSHTNTDDTQPAPAPAADQPTATTATAVAVPTNTAPPAVSTKPEVVVSSQVNIRQGPGTNYAIVGAANPGQRFDVTGKTAAGDWWQINFNGQSGWVFGQLVTPANVQAVAVAQNIPAPPPPTNTPVPPPATPVPVAQAPPPIHRHQRKHLHLRHRPRVTSNSSCSTPRPVNPTKARPT